MCGQVLSSWPGWGAGGCQRPAVAVRPRSTLRPAAGDDGYSVRPRHPGEVPTAPPPGHFRVVTTSVEMTPFRVLWQALWSTGLPVLDLALP